MTSQPWAPPARHSPRSLAPRRPRIGVVKFASCDGCQLTLLDLEDELLAIAERVDVVEFAEATSRRSAGPFDVLFVEGSISTEEQAEEIARLRAVSTRLITIGACATAGGIQAIRNWFDHDAIRAAVYPQTEFVESLAMARPVADFVAVDGELRVRPGRIGRIPAARRRRPRSRPRRWPATRRTRSEGHRGADGVMVEPVAIAWMPPAVAHAPMVTRRACSGPQAGDLFGLLFGADRAFHEEDVEGAGGPA